MYYVSKRVEIAGSHKLDLDYESKCRNLHGHNWIVTVWCKSRLLNKAGMIVDFTVIKEVVMRYDHANINDLLNVNPTAENMAKQISRELNDVLMEQPNDPVCTKVQVRESEGNWASYEL